jgi:phosphomannomutase
MDAALAAGAEAGADVIIANDPDADRCAVAVPVAGGLRRLTGDELGALLGWWIIERDRRAGRRTEGVFASSIVSSRLLGLIADAAGVGHVETLTGFKWIARAEGIRFGYEEAIGYCVAPSAVRDKDGISAAVLVAELVATLKAEGRGVQDVLDMLAAEHGLYATRQWSVRVADRSVIGAAMARLRERPPTRLAGSDVVSAVDLSAGADGLPPTDALRYLTAAGSRVIVRPSGTEPKLKAYLEVVVPDGDAGVADRRLRLLQEEIAEAAGLG